MHVGYIPSLIKGKNETKCIWNTSLHDLKRIENI